MMDIEKLIEQLSIRGLGNGTSLGYHSGLFDEAATALSAQQTENEKLRAELEQVREKNAGLALALLTECAPNPDCLGDDEWRAIRGELEQVKAERDAAVESIPHECKTCVYHTVFFNGCTPDHDCTNPDGGCSNNCDRWKWRGRKEG